jgi:deoxyribodipyrimidine photo-lyase
VLQILLLVLKAIMPDIQVVWFKKDLRIHDHTALFEASKRGLVLPVYIYEPEQLHHPEFAGHHLTYLNDCLSALADALARLGAPLLILHGEAQQSLARLHTQHNIQTIWAHQETGNAVSYARDRRVRAWAKAAGIAMREPPQNGVVRRLPNRDGWAKIWEERMTAALVPAPTSLRPHGIGAGKVLGHGELGVPVEQKSLPLGGEAVAQQTLASFLTWRGVNYAREMSSPISAEQSCSRLSAPLAFGTISMRQILQATRQAQRNAIYEPNTDPRWRMSLRSFESRLHWHCHFMQRLESEPDSEFQNINRAFDGLRENDWNENYFARFVEAQTGFPMVDACLRSLAATGWLNFRMRAMLVSFASQHLWLHWRRTGLFLARAWLDNEPGIHWSQVQMQSSTVGINTIRIYSPSKQAKDQDPNGVFIRRWLPELAAVSDEHIHTPWLAPESQRGSYPLPVVDEAEAAKLARSRIYAARRTPEFVAYTAQVLEQHGSRKRPNPKRRNAKKITPAS